MRRVYSFYYGRIVSARNIWKLNLSQEELNKVKEKKFKCLDCFEEVKLSIGVKRAFFRHKPGSTCVCGGGSMSKWHKDWQEKFDNNEVDYVFDNFSRNRADVSIYAYRIIELQNSKIGEKEFYKRNTNYSQYFSIIWLFNLEKEKDNIKYNTTTKMYNWKTMWPCFRGFDFKDYPKVQIYFQLYGESVYGREIYKVSFFNNKNGNTEFRVFNYLSKQEFFDEVTSVGIPPILKMSNGELKDQIFKYQKKDDNNRSFFYHYCQKEKSVVSKEKCESCKYHLFEKKKHYCYYPFDKLVNGEKITKVDLTTKKIHFEDGTEKNYKFNKYKMDRTIWQLYYDYEFDKAEPKIKSFNVINIHGEIYKVEIDNKKWIGYKLTSNCNEKEEIPSYNESIWRLW